MVQVLGVTQRNKVLHGRLVQRKTYLNLINSTEQFSRCYKPPCHRKASHGKHIPSVLTGE